MNLNNNQSNEFPMMSVLARNPLMAATISKVVEQPSNTGASTIRDPKVGALASLGEMNQISRLIQQDIQNFESFFQLFPDMNIDRLILIGAILAPNNMFREDLNYSIENRNLDSVLAGKIIQIVEEQINLQYGFVSELRKIVDNALFNRGSHVKVIIPESAVDYLINQNTSGNNMRLEGFGGLNGLFSGIDKNFSLGLLGNKRTASDTTYRREGYRESVEKYDPRITPDSATWDDYPEMKALVEKGTFTLTDDFSILKKPHYVGTFAQETVRDRIDAQRKGVTSMRMENAGITGINQTTTTPSVTGKTDARVTNIRTAPSTDEGTINLQQLRSAIFKSAPTEQEFFRRVPRVNNLNRHSIGPCLYIDAPSEAFIPIHYPGEPGRHAGYYALIDASSGYFLSLESQKQYLNSFSTQSGNISSNTSGGGMAGSIVDKARSNLVGYDQTSPLRYQPEIFGALMVEDYLERLKAGTLGFEVEAQMANSIAYVMMARANAGRQTQVVFLPSDFVSYFAFDHNANGTGRSLLAGVTNLLSLRAAALYSRVANQIRNAISITDVTVVLDERDHQPQKTLSKVIDLVTQSRAQFFPWGLNSASDIQSWWNRAGYQLNVEGHPALPKTKVSYEQRSHDHHMPDIADDSYLAEMVGHHLGITPEMKDAGRGADFATSIVNNNILFANRALGFQQTLNPQITAHVRKLVYNDSEIFSKIRKLIVSNWSQMFNTFDDAAKKLYEGIEQDEAIDSFMRVIINSLKAVLPPPEVTTIQNQSAAFKEFCEAIDDAFKNVLEDEALSTTIFGDDVAAATIILATNKAQIKRDWMQKNGYMQELFEIVSTDEEGKANSKLLSSSNEFSLSFAKNIIASVERYKTLGSAVRKDIGILNGTIEPDVQLPPVEEVPVEEVPDLS